MTTALNALPTPSVLPRAGRLELYPVPSLLFRLFQARATGILTVEGPGHRHELAVQRGCPTAVTLGGDSIDPLGRILLELGKIGDQDYQASLATLAASKRLHGQILREMGVISDSDLAQGLEVQLRRKLNRLFYLHQGTFRFEARSEPPDEAEEGEAPVNPLPVIVHGIRSAYDEARLQEVLTPLTGLELRLRPTFLERELELSGGERRVVSALAHFRTVAELVDARLTSPFETRMLLACLLFTEALELRDAVSAWDARHRAPPLAAAPGESQEVPRAGARVPADEVLRDDDALAAANARATPPPRGTPPRPTEPARRGEVEAPADDGTHLPPRPIRTVTPPPVQVRPERPVTASRATHPVPAARRGPATPAPKAASATPTVEEVEAYLLAKEKQMTGADFFAALEVEREAGAAEIKAAYFRLAKRFHPDRFLAGDLRSLRRRAESLFERISEAHDTLRSEERRRTYVQLLDDTRVRGDKRRAQTVAQADAHFARGQQAIAAGDWAGAEESLRRAIELFHDDAEYHATLGWAVYQNPNVPQRARRASAIKVLLKALSLQGDNERAHLTLGRIYELEGQHAEAGRHYGRVLELNPKSLDAATAVQRLRAATGAAPR